MKMKFKEKQLLKNTAIVSIGKICTQLITFFLLPLYTAVLTTAEYGIVDLLNTLVSFFLPVVTLQLEQGIFRFLIDKRENIDERKEVISTSFLVIFLQVLVFVAIFFIVSPFIHNDYKFFLIINLVTHVFASILLQVSRGLGDNFKYAFGSFLSGATSILLNVIFIVGLHLGAYGMLLATFIGNLTCVIYIFFSKKIYTFLHFELFNKNLAKSLFQYSIPLVPNMISWWIVNVSDRSLISIFLGVGANGLYSAANKFSTVITTLYTVFNLTWTESASLYIDGEDANQFFSDIFDMIIRLFGSLCLGIIAFMPFAFPILINNKFADAYWQIPILIIGVIFNVLVSFLGSIYVAKKITNEIAKTSILAAIINIVINFALIHYIGLYAASFSTALAYFAMFVYRYVDSKKYVILSVNKYFICLLVLAYLISIVSYYINIFALNIIVAIFVLLFVLLINRKFVHFIINIAKNKLIIYKIN